MKKLLSILLVLAMVLAFAACGAKEEEQPKAPETKTEEQPKEGTTEEKKEEKPAETKYAEEVVIGYKDDIGTLGPAADSSKITSQMLYYLTHETLIYYNPETKEFEPDLAKDWSITEDGLTITFHLNEGVKFHNGEEMTSEDVKYTYEVVIPQGGSKSKIKDLDSVDTPDAYTVVFHMKKRVGDMYYNIAQPNLSILSKKAIEAEGDDGQRIGTGPYKTIAWNQGDSILLEAFPDYRLGEAVTKKITIKVMKEASARVIALETGDIDICIDPASDDQDYIADNKDLELAHRGGAAVRYLSMNTTIAPFDNVDVRKAITMAINKEDCIKVGVGEGKAYALEGPMHHDVPLYVPVEGVEYNVEKAKELFDSTGVGSFEFEILTNSAETSAYAQVIQENLKALGITVTITQLDSNSLSARREGGDYQAVVQSYSNGSGPSSSFQALFTCTGGTNWARVNDPKVDTLFDEAGATSDVEVSKAKYAELNKYLIDQCYMVPICVPDVFLGFKKGIEGFKLGANARHDFSQVVKPEGK